MLEDGEVKNIPLDTQIDVESADSFTNINDPRLTHNRQKLQGGNLPSSVRFEHNGYACGWDVYNFTLESDPIEIIEHELYLKRFKRNDIGSYEFAFYKGTSIKDIEELPIASFMMIKNSYLRNYSIVRNVSLTDDNVSVTINFQFKQIDGSFIDVVVSATRDNSIDDSDDLQFGIIAIDEHGDIVSGLSIEGSTDRSNNLDTVINIKNMSQAFNISLGVDEPLHLPSNIINNSDVGSVFATLKDCVQSISTASSITYVTTFTSNMIEVILTSIYDSNNTSSHVAQITSVNNDLDDEQLSTSDNTLTMFDNILTGTYETDYTLKYLFTGNLYKFCYSVNNFNSSAPTPVVPKSYSDTVKTSKVFCGVQPKEDDNGEYVSIDGSTLPVERKLLTTYISNSSNDNNILNSSDTDNILYFNNDTDRSKVPIVINIDTVNTIKIKRQNLTYNVDITDANKIESKIIFGNGISLPLKYVTMLDININGIFRSDVRSNGVANFNYMLFCHNAIDYSFTDDDYYHDHKILFNMPYINNDNCNLFYNYDSSFTVFRPIYGHRRCAITFNFSVTDVNNTTTNVTKTIYLRLDNMISNNIYAEIKKGNNYTISNIVSELSNTTNGSLKSSLDLLIGNVYYAGGNSYTLISYNISDLQLDYIFDGDSAEAAVEFLPYLMYTRDGEQHVLRYMQSKAITLYNGSFFNSNVAPLYVYTRVDNVMQATLNTNFIEDRIIGFTGYTANYGILFYFAANDKLYDIKAVSTVTDTNYENSKNIYDFFNIDKFDNSVSDFVIMINSDNKDASTVTPNCITLVSNNSDVYLDNKTIYCSFISTSQLYYTLSLTRKLNLNDVTTSDFVVEQADKESENILNVTSVSYNSDTKQLSFAFNLTQKGKLSLYYIPSDFSSKVSSNADYSDKPGLFIPGDLINISNNISGIIYHKCSSSVTRVAGNPSYTADTKDYYIYQMPLASIADTGSNDTGLNYTLTASCNYIDTMYIDSDRNVTQLIDTNSTEKNYNNNTLFNKDIWNLLHNCNTMYADSNYNYSVANNSLTGYIIYKVEFTRSGVDIDLYLRFNILSEYITLFDMFNIYDTLEHAQNASVSRLNSQSEEVTVTINQFDTSAVDVDFTLCIDTDVEISLHNLKEILDNMYINATTELSYNISIPMFDNKFDDIKNITKFDCDILRYNYTNNSEDYDIDFMLGGNTVECKELGYSENINPTWFSNVFVNGTPCNIVSNASINVYQTAMLQLYLYSTTFKDKLTINSFNHDNINLSIHNTEYSNIVLDIDAIFNPNIKNYLMEKFVDTRDETLHEKYIQKINTDDAFMYIRQMWETSTEIENMWWLDHDHILVLTKEHIKIYTKDTSEVDSRGMPLLDDWNGDRWKLEASDEHFRTNFIDSDCVDYFATNCYKMDHALFVVVQFIDDISAYIHIYDFIDNANRHKYFELRLEHKEINSKLNVNNKVINTYSNISMRTLLSKAVFTSTVINYKLIIGIHYDNNYNQWALVYDLNSNKLDKIVQGYGYCSLKGELTGGEIPVKYFDIDYGFNNTVFAIDTLNTKPEYIKHVSDIYKIDERVVGNDSTQWYISANLNSGIVNSINLSNDTYITLPISNNYTVNYGSPSFSCFTAMDIGLNFKALADLLPGEKNVLWNAMMIAFGYPVLYYMAPKFTTMCYLQQSGGQAAYVHYNSNINPTVHNQKESTDTEVNNDNLESKMQYQYLQNNDSTIFDIQHLEQTLSTEVGTAYSLLLMLVTSGISAIKYTSDSVGASYVDNDDKSKRRLDFSFDDSNKSYSSIFTSNMENLNKSDFDVNSLDITKNTAITFAKSLDMFYSTSNTQKVCAGPGYVNHNFVAQCIAQSFTVCQLGLNQYKLQYIITALTTYQIKIEYGIAKSLRDDIDAAFIKANGGSSWFMAGLASGSSWQIIQTIIGGILYAAASATAAILEVSAELLPTIVDALGGDKIQASMTAQKNRAINDFEAKHRYGTKTECFMYPCYTNNTEITVTNESVSSTMENKPWKINTPISDKNAGITVNDNITVNRPELVTLNNIDNITENLDGEIPYYIYKIQGIHKTEKLAKNIATIQGVSSFLPETPYKNEAVGDSQPVFTTPIIHDYIIDDEWKLTVTASGDNGIIWTASNDTKLIDGATSNIVIGDDYCVLASPYCALEVKKSIDIRYLRPELVTPISLALNISDYNIVHEGRSYNAFDGVGYRIINWSGDKAMLINKHMMFYNFVANDRFKRFNKLPPLSVLGNFTSMPSIKAAYANDPDKAILKVINATDSITAVEASVIGEDISARRYALPIFTEPVATLPAQVKTIESYPLVVYDGITSVCTDIRNTQSKYKVPLSVDFNINKNLYRYTKEYICSVYQKNGVVVLEQLVPVEGLTFLGATPYEAFFYSTSNRLYYTYTGGTALRAVDMIERFRNVKLGRYDFIEQSVAMECITDMSRIDEHISDKVDDTDNVFIANLKNGTFDGEVCPPNTTIFNERSWFKVYSLPSGIVFQGPNRCHIHRNIPSAYMTNQIKSNLGKWIRVPKEYFHPFRIYPEVFNTVTEQITDGVTGWTHNPFVFVTSMLGTDIHQDCKFEWEITFSWTDEMDVIYEQNNYAIVSIMAETITQGGKVTCRPTHIYLTKELFSRTGNQGYYTFRFQSNNGIGNRERLFIWSDAYIAINEVLLNYKVMTNQRTSILTQQVDIQQLSEL